MTNSKSILLEPKTIQPRETFMIGCPKGWALMTIWSALLNIIGFCAIPNHVIKFVRIWTNLVLICQKRNESKNFFNNNFFVHQCWINFIPTYITKNAFLFEQFTKIQRRFVLILCKSHLPTFNNLSRKNFQLQDLVFSNQIEAKTKTFQMMYYSWSSDKFCPYQTAKSMIFCKFLHPL